MVTVRTRKLWTWIYLLIDKLSRFGRSNDYRTLPVSGIACFIHHSVHTIHRISTFLSSSVLINLSTFVAVLRKKIKKRRTLAKKVDKGSERIFDSYSDSLPTAAAFSEQADEQLCRALKHTHSHPSSSVTTWAQYPIPHPSHVRVSVHNYQHWRVYFYLPCVVQILFQLFYASIHQRMVATYMHSHTRTHAMQEKGRQLN